MNGATGFYTLYFITNATELFQFAYGLEIHSMSQPKHSIFSQQIFQLNEFFKNYQIYSWTELSMQSSSEIEGNIPWAIITKI